MQKFELDLLNDLSAQKKISKWSIILILLSIIPFFALNIFSPSSGTSALLLPESLSASLGGFSIFLNVIAVVAIFLVLVVVHEAIHGILFKVFAPREKVKFGFKAGMAYATSPGSVFSRGQFIIIILAPFVIITTLLIIGMFVLPHGSYKYLLIGHTGACIGDFYYVYLVLKHPHLKYCMDTDTGMNMYKFDPRT
ncbi:DUF3267 domain-containing protein [Aliicoccus persicus]|uniref:Zincin peptidase n=1 Tax=Aliicoccus persicus TaxID=930138 RepID=A0A662Z4S1_9STAP|nr:DUF3267 domain-containing protein [Aliicoccus persicus]SEW12406.1 Putative zincin peptidase [Aliicoccus persicus]